MAFAIVTPQEMSAAEQCVFAAGTPSFDVMTRAGEGVADHLHTVFPEGRIRVLCGPGGNGGDGFVAAARLRALGRTVSVYLQGDTSRLSGDSARAARRWDGPVEPLEDAIGAPGEITLDALFGGGLSRPLRGAPAQLAGEAGTVVSVDVPSGLDGLTARPLGPCFQAALTVTFAAYRPAHLLSPGRGFCGRVRVQEIGVPVSHTVRVNDLSVWAEAGIGCDRVSGWQVLHRDAFETAFAADALNAPNRIVAVRDAARRSGEVILLSGSETLVAHPAGACIVDPWAGHGALDSSRIEKARAAGLPVFLAACKAVWEGHDPPGPA